MIKLRVIVYFAFLIVFVCGCSNNKFKILIIGDSISNGYAPTVRWQLRKIADVKRIEGNGMHTRNGLQKIDDWIGDEKWDLVLFNWGLWDLCYRIPEHGEIGKQDKVNGIQEVPLENYSENLDLLVKKLKSTNAILVFVTSTYAPPLEPGINSDDVPKYNKAAKEIMQKHNVTILDIYTKSKEVHKRFGVGQDDAHFTKQGYGILGMEISDFLLKELGEARY